MIRNGSKYAAVVAPVRLEGIEPIHSENAEKSLLGAILSNSGPLLEEFPEIMELMPEDFFNPAYSQIFEALKEMHLKKKGIDISTVIQHLEDKNLLNEVGGHAVFGNLLADLVSIATTPTHLQTIKEKSILRNLTQECARIIVNCRDRQHDFEGVKASAETAMTRAFERTSSSRYRTSAEVMHDFCAHQDNIIKKGLPSGVLCGLPSIDDLTFGFNPGELVVIGARTSVGKTAFALSLLRNISRSKIVESDGVLSRVTPGYCTAIHSLEMKDIGLARRFVAMEAGIDMQLFKTGKMSKSDQIAMAAASEEISNWNMFFDDSFGQNMSTIASKAKGLKRKFGDDFKVLCIDQLTLLRPTENNDSRREQICAMTRGAKGLAFELGITVFLLAQIGRTAEESATKEPQLHHLKESGSIEEDADIVFLLSRNTQQKWTDIQPAICNIAKQRDGEPARLEIGYKQTQTQWVERERKAV